mmetsp:Transcript_44650/g.126300  ORF Transcript_44650/g.126300 Transcript_44650/m.126300 type:complete len:203 (+) Transcript_44650:827-1435(+)
MASRRRPCMPSWKRQSRRPTWPAPASSPPWAPSSRMTARATRRMLAARTRRPTSPAPSPSAAWTSTAAARRWRACSPAPSTAAATRRTALTSARRSTTSPRAATPRRSASPPSPRWAPPRACCSVSQTSWGTLARSSWTSPIGRARWPRSRSPRCLASSSVAWSGLRCHSAWPRRMVLSDVRSRPTRHSGRFTSRRRPPARA